MTYPSGQNYGTQSYGTTCNDLQCKIDECCIETYRSAQCVALAFDSTTNQAFCPRLKKCFSNSHCPATFCCVQYLDTTYARTCPNNNVYGSQYGNGYGNIYSNSYGNAYGSSPYGYAYDSGYGVDISTKLLDFPEGYCVPGAANGEVCYKAVPGSSITGTCPCKDSGKVCKITLDPFPIGKCA
ncbi:uncharacterized protein LOC129926974 [Biomphalaria glabrata]|uniref:Uncharacterized protein LOC129926974 n=1 Tax=Biomphalaria glabrata TaxID=6526 RepID=A0A9W3ARZ4_BIOGL|nr:uncharacterized protein LOC129926974 [Biomphalaria glabrata]